jgi:molybdenum cofactor cytidylyltransferase
LSAPRKQSEVAALVLAAGASIRMGGGVHKLLARVAGEPIVSRSVRAALASRAGSVVVVTGHRAEDVRAALAGCDVAFAHNPDYARGLAGSLRCGLAALDRATAGALCCLADMPWVSAAHLDLLIAAFERSPASICVPVRAGRRGNPVLWPSRHFPALAALEGDTGGRALLERLAGDVVTVAMPDDAVTRDVDTPDDLARDGRGSAD